MPCTLLPTAFVMRPVRGRVVILSLPWPRHAAPNHPIVGLLAACRATRRGRPSHLPLTGMMAAMTDETGFAAGLFAVKPTCDYR